MLGALFGSVKWLLSSKVSPLQDKIKDLSEENKKQSDEIDELKQDLVDDVKEISKGNFEFRLKYENALNEIKLLLAEKYTCKEQCDKNIADIKKRIEQNSELHQIHHEVQTIRNTLEKEGKRK